MKGQMDQDVSTPYGQPSSPLTMGTIGSQEVVFVARHGSNHSILPHDINYRANLWALREAGADVVIAVATVGGIAEDCAPGTIVIPDQVLDYTHSRQSSFAPLDGEIFHIDFTEPYCHELRRAIIECADRLGITVIKRGTYVATQGPRFESAAEIQKFAADGAHVVGMTGMPETSLAREIGICYATVALVVNRAAGQSGDRISAEEITDAQKKTSAVVQRMLSDIVPGLEGFSCQVPPRISP